MPFPIKLISKIDSSDGPISRNIVLNSGLTVLLGPNGSGKTHFLRGLKSSFSSIANGKKVRFLSAGRMGMTEQFRSDYNGQHGGNPQYDSASYGSKKDLARRHQAETLNGDFQTLAERADILIKIQERLKKLFRRHLIVDWDAGSLKLSFARLERDSQPYSSGREASGLMHLVGILSALYDDEVGALLLDEPEVSLHPQLQAFLLNEMLSVAGVPTPKCNRKFIVIATHSTELVQIVKPQDLLSLVFCHDLKTEPIQIPASAGVLKSKKIETLLTRLGQEHKLSLFCQRPLLVEGPSDVLICSVLARKSDLHLEASGSQILPVIGKGQMPVVAKLMRLTGKSPVVLTDADGIADGLELMNQLIAECDQINERAARHGFASATEMAGSIYSDFCAIVKDHWLEIQGLATRHPYWINRKENDDVEQSKRRAAFSTLFSVSDTEVVATGVRWRDIKSRLEALLDLLETCGLFVLRKGSIESYYQRADQLTTIGKPVAAADEMEHIEQLEKTMIESSYSDILRSIAFAANTEPIRESDSIRDLLLSIVAPAHARLISGETDTDFNLLARTILGDRAKIFDISVKNDSLLVSVASNILDVTAFPISIPKSSDAISVVNEALRKR